MIGCRVRNGTGRSGQDDGVKQRVKGILKQLTDIISGWDRTSAVVAGEASKIETFDPYFTIDLDVYHRGDLLPSNDRRDRLGNPAGFETSPVYPVDRFLQDDLPVSISYKDVSRINLLLARVEEQSWVFRRESTELLYRIQKGDVLYAKGKWFEEVRERLKTVPEGFWKELMEATRFSLDYYLSGIGAAVYRGDNLFYQLSASGFCRSLCSYVYAMNRQFEPTGRLLHEQIKRLETLPEEFLGRFESFIRPDAKLPPERKYEIAKLLAKSI